MELNIMEEFKKKYRHKYSEDTMVNYLSDMKQFLSYMGEELNLTSHEAIIEASDWDNCTDYFNTLQDKQLAPTTVNRKIYSIKKLFDFCILKKMISENPMTHVEVASTKGMKKKNKYLTFEEMEKLLAVIKVRQSGDRNFDFISKRDTLLYTLLLTIGLRISEATNLKFKDIDFKKKTIEIVGKGGVYAELPINEDVIEAYNKYMVEREKINISSGCEDLVFLTHQGNKMNTRNSNDTLKKYCERAGIQVVSNHILRHSCASYMVAKGVHTEMVSKVMRHANSSTTSANYIHTSVEELRNIIGIN